MTGLRRLSQTEALDGSGADLAARVRPLFPCLDQAVNGRALAYLDSAATTQRPEPARRIRSR